jgi:hypothetical protein
MKEEIEKVLAELDELKCLTRKEVEDARVRFLGKKGVREGKQAQDWLLCIISASSGA